MAGQARIPAGDPRRGRIHPGEFSAPAKKKPPGRRDKGARGRAGTAVPKSAPIHDRKVVHPKASSVHHDPAGSKLPEEMVGGFSCKSCGWQGWREHPVVTKEGAKHATLAMIGCTNCGTMHPAVNGVGATQRALQANKELKRRARAKRVGKTVDTGETALLGDSEPSLVGHRTNCPRGGNSACGAEVEGRCSLCDTTVQDHQALGKVDLALLDLRKLAGLA